jgi:hypothetical protein
MTDILNPKLPIPSSATPDQLGAALARADLTSIEDPAKRARAFMNAITGLMIDTVHNPEVRANLVEARLNAARR